MGKHYFYVPECYLFGKASLLAEKIVNYQAAGKFFLGWMAVLDIAIVALWYWLFKSKWRRLHYVLPVHIIIFTSFYVYRSFVAGISNPYVVTHVLVISVYFVTGSAYALWETYRQGKLSD